MNLSRKILSELLLSIFFACSLFFTTSPISAETIDMQYTDPDHLHAPKEVTIDGVEVDYQYDANGNLVNDGERIISWNQDNMPTKIVKGDTEVNFFYDADGNRIIKKVGEDKIIYVSSSYQKSTIDGQETATKYYFANGRVAQLKEDNLSFLHQDHLGSNVLATNSNSEPLGETLSYFPYGNFVNNSVTQLSSNPKYLFTGQESDNETGLYNYNARLYNPRIGSFISADILGLELNYSQKLNRFSYVINNPLRHTDPSGLKIPGETQEEARLRMQQNRRRIEQQKQTQLVLEQSESPVEQILRLGSRLRELVGGGGINSTNIEDIIADIKDEFEWNVLDAIIDSVRQDSMGQTEVGNLHCPGFVRSYTRMAGGELPRLGGGSYEVGVDLSSSGFIWHSSDDIQKRAYEVKEGDILSYRSRGKDEGSFSNHLAVITDPNGLLAEAVGGTFRWNGINAGKGGVLVNQRSFDFTSGSATGVPAEQTEGVISWIVGWGVYSMNF